MKGLRVLREFRIRGVKTNLPFLENVLLPQDVRRRGGVHAVGGRDGGAVPVPAPARPRHQAAAYLAEVIVNGHPTIKKHLRRSPLELEPPRAPVVPPLGQPPPAPPRSSKQRGRRGAGEVGAGADPPLITDTTMRDAHQSLVATRMRTYDLLQVAPATRTWRRSCSRLSAGGGATFDNRVPLPQRGPLAAAAHSSGGRPQHPAPDADRGANAVGYTSYRTTWWRRSSR